MNKKLCKTCGYLHPQQPICQLRGEQVDPNADFCSKHQEIYEVETCAICGRPIYNINLLLDVQEDGSVRYLHFACGKALNTCATCANSQACEFDTNPDPMPKVVMQTVRQGNMVMQTQVRNPDRINKLCLKCNCYKDGFCCKEYNCCSNYSEMAAK